MFWRKKSIAQKLVEIVAEMPRLTKNGHRADFSYLEIRDVANAFYGCAKAAGIVVVPNDLEASISEDGVNAWVKTEFRVTDGEFAEHYSSFGFGRSEGKWGGLPIAQTMALKAWLKRLGMMFGEEDDAEHQGHDVTPEPDFFAEPPEATNVPRETVAEPSLEDLGRPDLAQKIAEQERIDESDCRKFNAACKVNGKTIHQRRMWLHKNFGVRVITELQKHDFPAAMEFALQNDLLKTLEDSVAIEQAEQAANGPNGAITISEDEHDAGREPVKSPF